MTVSGFADDDDDDAAAAGAGGGLLRFGALMERTVIKVERERFEVCRVGEARPPLAASSTQSGSWEMALPSDDVTMMSEDGWRDVLGLC